VFTLARDRQTCGQMSESGPNCPLPRTGVRRVQICSRDRRRAEPVCHPENHTTLWWWAEGMSICVHAARAHREMKKRLISQ